MPNRSTYLFVIQNINYVIKQAIDIHELQSCNPFLSAAASTEISRPVPEDKHYYGRE
jgi:hypothetical protein